MKKVFLLIGVISIMFLVSAVDSGEQICEPTPTVVPSMTLTPTNQTTPTMTREPTESFTETPLPTATFTQTPEPSETPEETHTPTIIPSETPTPFQGTPTPWPTKPCTVDKCNGTG